LATNIRLEQQAMDYRAEEAATLEQAKQAHDEDLRHLYLTIAKQWRLVADAIETRHNAAALLRETLSGPRSLDVRAASFAQAGIIAAGQAESGDQQVFERQDSGEFPPLDVRSDNLENESSDRNEVCLQVGSAPFADQQVPDQISGSDAPDLLGSDPDRAEILDGKVRVIDHIEISPNSEPGREEVGGQVGPYCEGIEDLSERIVETTIHGTLCGLRPDAESPADQVSNSDDSEILPAGAADGTDPPISSQYESKPPLASGYASRTHSNGIYLAG
jgi:hypothetical protein